MRRIADPRIAGPGDNHPRPEVISALGTVGANEGTCLVIHRRIETVAESRRRTGVVYIVQRFPQGKTLAVTANFQVSNNTLFVRYFQSHIFHKGT
jgi:hypothetical protein